MPRPPMLSPGSPGPRPPQPKPQPPAPKPKTFADRCTPIYTRRGAVAHLMSPDSSMMDGRTLCPAMPSWPGDWLGTGGQDEYERAATLPVCKACAKRAGAEDDYYSEPSQFSQPETAGQGAAS